MFKQSHKPNIIFQTKRLIYINGEKPAAQTESSDKSKLSLNDTQTYEGRKKIAAEAGKKIQEMAAKGEQEQSQTLKQLLQEYYASGRDLEKAKQSATNLYQKLDTGARTTPSGIILMGDSPFSALSELNSKIPTRDLPQHQSKAPTMGEVIDLDSEDQNNPIAPQAIAQRDGSVKIETPLNGVRVNQGAPASVEPTGNQPVVNLAPVEINGELRQEVSAKEIGEKIGNEQYLEALVKFRSSDAKRVEFKTKDNHPAYIESVDGQFKVYLI
jgi:hypothetical protein